jgi:ribonuclease PH
MKIDPSSYPPDVIMIGAMGEIHGLPTTIRSMHTANINAALVILADAAAAKHMLESIPSLISSCGVVVVDIGPLDAYQLKGRYQTRWHLVHMSGFDQPQLVNMGYLRV